MTVLLKIWRTVSETIPMKDFLCPKSVKNYLIYIQKMDSPMRKFIVERFSTLLEIPESDPICINLEKNIFNYAIDSTSGDASWDNKCFVMFYKSKFLSIQFTMKNNPEIKKRLVDKKIKTVNLVNMRPEELWFDGPRAKTIDERIHKEMRKEYLAKEMKTQDGFFTCNRCKSKKTTYYQLQTRSADEPMTTFVSCLNCNKNWKC
jgi:DNA-directed RNA polymerase subunit M/transcription elongation factor TFIIS